MTLKEIQKLYEKNQNEHNQQVKKFRTILRDFYDHSHVLIQSVPDDKIKEIFSDYLIDNILTVSGDCTILFNNEEEFSFEDPILTKPCYEITKHLEEFHISFISFYFNLEETDTISIYLNTEDYLSSFTTLSEQINQWNLLYAILFKDCFGKYLKSNLEDITDTLDIDIRFFS